MKLEQVLTSTQNYENLCALAEKAEPKISFWGSERIVIDGYQGSVGIEAITSRVFEMLAKNEEFSEVERGYGKRIASRINHIYEGRDEILKARNIVTKILVFLRNLSLQTSPRGYWEFYEAKYTFDSYTTAQFRSIFGYSIDDAIKRGVKLDQLFGSNDRWRVLA